jgi:glutamine amidotransferase
MSSPTVAIVDYGLGNLYSVQSAFEYLGIKSVVTADPQTILNSKKIVLPGVGAFPKAMQSLKNLGLVPVINELNDRRIPLLGICLGMQLLMESSEEFELTRGLGLIPGRVVQVPNKTITGEPHKTPHIGWNSIRHSNKDIGWNNSLLQDNKIGDSTYFVHSFMAVPSELKNIIAHTLYGGHEITAAVTNGHIFGCQFHPEKSGKVGLKILARFVSI